MTRGLLTAREVADSSASPPARCCAGRGREGAGREAAAGAVRYVPEQDRRVARRAVDGGRRAEEVSPAPDATRHPEVSSLLVTRPAANRRSSEPRRNPMPGPDPRGSVFRPATAATASAGRRAASGRSRPASRRRRGARVVRRARGAAAARRRARPVDHVRRVLRPVPRAARRDRREARRETTLEERLASSRERFGAWTLRELEGAAGDIAKWRADALGYVALPADAGDAADAQRRRPLALPARRTRPSTPGRNPQPRSEELRAVHAASEIDALADELGPVYGPLVVFAAETGLRTNEWVALERRDVDRAGRGRHRAAPLRRRRR